MAKRNKQFSSRVGILVIVMVTITSVLQVWFVPQAFAVAELTEGSVRLDRTDVSHLADATDPILVVAKGTSTATETTVKLTFGADFGVNATPANITISTTGLPSTYQGESLTSWLSIGATAASVSGQQVTINSGDIVAGTLYGFYITGGITNPGTAGGEEVTILTQAAGPTAVDTKTVSVDIVTNDTDLIAVTASVVPTFNFALSGNSIALGDLSTSAVTSGNVTIDIDTNAANGWIAFTKSANAGLVSTVMGDEIDTQGTVNDAPTDYVASSEFYQLDVTVSNGTGPGTPSIDAEYDGDADTGGTFSSTYEEIAISTGPGDSDGITFNVRAAASTVNEAADDYADTLTVVGAGSF